MTAATGYVYVLAFSNGMVKVGRTGNASRRLSAHKSSARVHGLAVTEEWVSPLHAEWYRNEDALKRIVADLGGTTAAGKEYFTGVPFAAVVEQAKGLPFTAEAPVAGEPPVRDSRLGTLRAAADERREWENLMTDIAHDLLNKGIGLDKARIAFVNCPTAGPAVIGAMEDILHSELRMIQKQLGKEVQVAA